MKDDECSNQEERESAHDENRADPALGAQPSPDEKGGDNEKQSRSEQSKILREWLTIGTLFVAGAAALYQDHILARQANLLEGQLAEMRTASVQTDQLIKSNADLAAAAKAQAIASQENAKTAHEALQASQRARIAAMNVSIDGLQVGQPVRANFSYSNIGHEGTSIDVGMRLKLETEDEWNKGFFGTQIADYAQKCMNVASVNGYSMAYPVNNYNGYSMAYPVNNYFGGGYTNILKSDADEMDSEKFLADEDLVKGNKVLIALSCMTYRTFSQIHHTVACFFYQAKVTPNFQALNICKTGNSAD